VSLASLEEKVLSAIESAKPHHEEFLRGLIQIKSHTGMEGPAQKVILQKFQSMGLEIEEFVPDLDALKDHPEFLPPTQEYGNYQDRPNVIGTLKGTGGGRSLLLFGHIDTVPEGPHENWSHDPFGAEVEDGKMYGRGSQDMKSGLAAVILALDTLLQLGVKPKGDVILMSNIEEEIGGSGGILACIEKGIRADGCVYPHPGWGKPDMVQVASSGAIAFRVRVTGRAVHGLMAHVGVNAIEKAMRIIQHLRDLDDHRANTVRDELTEAAFQKSGLPPRATTLCISKIEGGDWIYQVPNECVIECILTYPHTEKESAVREAISETIQKAGEADPFLKDHPPELEWLPIRFSPSTMALDEPFLDEVKECMTDVLGKSPTVAANPVGSDTRVTVLYGNMPTVNIGPRGAGGHALNEWVDLASYHQTIQMIALIIMRWCGVKT
jgi:acetylornithine deacetylase